MLHRRLRVGRHRPPAGPGLAALALVAFAVTARAADAPPALVLPPGQEAAIEALLAPPGATPPETISIRGGTIAARWADGRTMRLVRRHAADEAHDPSPSATRPAWPATMSPTVEGPWKPDDLVRLFAHIRAGEAGLRWTAPPASAAGLPEAATTAAAGRDADARLQRLLSDGERNMRLGERDKARQTLGAGLGLPAAPLLRLRLGVALRGADDARGAPLVEAALADLARAVSATDAPDSPAAVAALAGRAMVAPQESADAAEGLLSSAEAAKGQSALQPCRLFEVARSLQLAGAADRAKALLDRVRTLDPACEAAWVLGGGLLATTGGDWRAIADHARAGLRHHQGHLELLALLANALHGGRQLPEAAEVWEEVVRRRFDYPGAIGLLATVYTQHPEVHDDAFLQRFIDRAAADPDDLAARFVRGTIHYYRGEYDQVVAVMDPLRAVVPLEPRVHLYPAMAHFHLGHRAEADERLAAVERLGHDDPDIYYCRSIVNRDRDFEQSLRDLETFVALSKTRHNSPAKVEKMLRELEVMRAGRVPNAFDLLPAVIRQAIYAAAGLLVIGLGLWLLRRRSASA